MWFQGQLKKFIVNMLRDPETTPQPKDRAKNQSVGGSEVFRGGILADSLFW